MECHSPGKAGLSAALYGADRPQHFPEVLLEKGAAKRNSPYTLALQEVEECLPDRKSAEEEVEARELARVIACFLDTLSAENRVIFMRRYWFSDSCRDIAGLVGLSEKNISVRLARIRRKLKQYLAEREAFL